jgi:hypothetical protein
MSSVITLSNELVANNVKENYNTTRAHPNPRNTSSNCGAAPHGASSHDMMTIHMFARDISCLENRILFSGASPKTTCLIIGYFSMGQTLKLDEVNFEYKFAK